MIYTVTPCAKINLGLNVTEKRSDGYHNIETVFYPVPIFDTIVIKETNEPNGTCHLKIEGNAILGNPENNLVVKAYRKLHELYTLPGVEITLNKNIPTQAGMGGGSADCAYTLTTLNNMFNIGIDYDTLVNIAAQLGADCPFFIKSQPAFATGIGEVLLPIDFNLDNYCLAIVKPQTSVSTREAFAGIKPQKPKQCCKEIVANLPISEWKEKLNNDFENTIFPLHPELKQIKEALYFQGALYAAMSGSGSALFGIFKEKPKLKFNGCRVECIKMHGAMEQFPIVDETGKTVGKTTRLYAHSGMKPLHPVVHLHVFNAQGKLFLQKRPEWKDIQPGKWDTAVGGHIDFGEDVENALFREAKEELGISGFTPTPIAKYIYESSIECELIHAFSTIYDMPIHTSEKELDGGRFFSHKEIEQLIGKDFFTPNFENEWLRLFKNR